ncbi:hypothetical protein [Futiania mangrovi]|uniref:Uncharacterized protein n=1 Tax=Futiania mangrovi TaxID=2959716 RepID=A0A9J6PFR5_9PROT|nr:hypothetical protein [Futiania mangrovii]MCP1337561.1 hypothetical protein [Futiania mangrovii]
MLEGAYSSVPADAGNTYPQDFALPTDAPATAGAEPAVIANVAPEDPAVKACLDDITALRNIKVRMDRLAEEIAIADPNETRYVNNLLNGIQREAAEAEKICARIERNCANLGIAPSQLGNVHHLCDQIRTVARAAQEQQDAMNKGLNFDLGAVTDAIGQFGGAVWGVVLMILGFLFGGQRQGAF